MVNRVNKDCCATHSVRQTALKLEDDKRKLEEELKEYLEILTTNNTDMNEALVDADGYPRADIDVYQVRQARHKIICIKNDLRKIMHDIEKCLHIVHAENSPGTTENMDVEIIPDTPVARVTAVISGSPASEAGLKVGDLVTHFGSVNSSNFNNLTDISNIVQHSINQLVKVIVLRNEAITKVYLTPRTWSGSGMLGCVLLPFENVER